MEAGIGFSRRLLPFLVLGALLFSGMPLIFVPFGAVVGMPMMLAGFIFLIFAITLAPKVEKPKWGHPTLWSTNLINMAGVVLLLGDSVFAAGNLYRHFLGRGKDLVIQSDFYLILTWSSWSVVNLVGIGVIAYGLHLRTGQPIQKHWPIILTYELIPLLSLFASLLIYTSGINLSI